VLTTCQTVRTLTNIQLTAECSIVADRCFYTCDWLDLSRGCLLHHLGLVCHGWCHRFEWCTWRLPKSTFSHLESIRFWISWSQTPCHLSHGDCAILALDSDLYRIISDDCHAHCHLAKLCAPSQPSSRKCWYHKLRDVESSSILEPTTSFPPDQASQTEMVLRLQSFHHNHCCCGDNYCSLHDGWWLGYHLESTTAGPRSESCMADYLYVDSSDWELVSHSIILPSLRVF
jgi:hypothetical protein